MMRLSFIVISYNEREYLAEAIDSCLNKDIKDSEIIIADDGSTDGSIELIQEYAEKYPHIKYFVNDRSDAIPGKVIAPIRVSNNIKHALEIAQGQYCQLLSGDDYFLPGDFCQKAMDFLDKHPRYVTCAGGFKKVWPDKPELLCLPMCPAWIAWGREYLHISAFIFRKEVFDQGMFLPRFCDDTGLHYSLAVTGKWKYFNKDLVMAYRQRSGSIMHEADYLELSILEMMLLQDTLSIGKLKFLNRAHFHTPLFRVFKRRHELDNPKYEKYLDNCAQYPNNMLDYIKNYDILCLGDKLKFQIWLGKIRFADATTRAFVFGIRAKRKILRILKNQQKQ